MTEGSNFECNLCGGLSPYRREDLHRELPSCVCCGSTVRHRQVAHAYGAISQSRRQTARHEMRVLGLSDAPLIEKFFLGLEKVRYLNTFVDEAPVLDIVQPPKSFLSSADVVVSSDVLEHVPFPVNQALVGKFKILKPGGWLLLTVPYSVKGPSVEHYPWMVDYETVIAKPDLVRVIGIDRSGSKMEISDPVFHGGPGKTLEMRQLTLEVILDELKRAGFIDVRVLDEEQPTLGIIPTACQGVFIAKKPKQVRKLFRRKRTLIC